MSDFVAECRREWKRLGVPDAVADEMAADLAADLSEAAAEGVSAEEVLGAGAADPRSFAASWAGERGVIKLRPVKRRRIRTPVLTATALLSAAALAAGVAILATPSATTSALPAPATWAAPRTIFAPTTHKVTWIDVGRGGAARVHSASIKIAPLPVGSLGNNLVAPDGTPAFRSTRGTNTDVTAWALTVAGIVGILLTTLYWRRASRRQSPSQYPDTEERAASYA